MAVLVSDTGVSAGDVRLISYEQMEWPSAGLGCPEPGVFYAQVLTPGWKYLIGLGDEVYEFHANQSGETLINCTAVEKMRVGTINVVSAAGLRDTVSIAVLRLNFATGEYEENSVTDDPDVIEGIVDVLDVDIKISPAEDCPAIFQLRFDLPGRSETFEWICEGDNTLLTGGQPFWGGGQGEAPIALGGVIGPLLAKTPPPAIPQS